jgi:hypothetical protein
MINIRKIEEELLAFALAVVVFGTGTVVLAATIVPGHSKEKNDQDNNGIPDVGVVVNGKYTSVYAYDGDGGWYWDLGDGRVNGSVGSIEELNPLTLTTCYYQVQYRGTFENDPFMNTGWIMNNINCAGFDDNGQYNYLIVHETDPRYRGNPEWAVWGNWEYHILTESGKGNLVRPYKPVTI